MASVRISWVAASGDNATQYQIDVVRTSDNVQAGSTTVDATAEHCVTMGDYQPGSYVASVTPINPDLPAVGGRSQSFTIPAILTPPESVTVEIV